MTNDDASLPQTKITSKPDHAITLARLLSDAYEPEGLDPANKHDIKAAIRLLESEKFLLLMEEVLGTQPSRSRSSDPHTIDPSYAPAFSKARDIGEELAAIEVALEQGKTAFSNTYWGDVTYSPHKFWETPLFQALTGRREYLRQQLLEVYK